MWIFAWPSRVLAAFGCACGTMTATLPRTRGSASATKTDGPAGTPVPRKLTDGRLEAPKREAPFSVGRTLELMFVTSGTSLRSGRQLAHGHVGSLNVAP